MEVVLRCENDVQFDALTVVDYTIVYWFGSHCRVSSLVINLLTIFLSLELLMNFNY